MIIAFTANWGNDSFQVKISLISVRSLEKKSSNSWRSFELGYYEYTLQKTKEPFKKAFVFWYYSNVDIIFRIVENFTVFYILIFMFLTDMKRNLMDI